MQAASRTLPAPARLAGAPAQAIEALRRLLWGREHYIAFRDHPIVYGRIPKAANSTIKVMLARLLDGQRRGVSPDNFWKLETGGRTSMLRTRDAARLSGEKLVFSFVRNPMDRLASFYDNKVRDANAYLPMAAQKMGITKEDSLARVVGIVCDTPPDRMDVHVLPQADILVHRGRLVPGFVGRYETFSEDWERLRQQVLGRHGLDLGQFRTKPSHRVRSRSIEDYYGDPKLLEAVRRRYAEDLRLFYPGEGRKSPYPSPHRSAAATTTPIATTARIGSRAAAAAMAASVASVSGRPVTSAVGAITAVSTAAGSASSAARARPVRGIQAATSSPPTRVA